MRIEFGGHAIKKSCRAQPCRSPQRDSPPLARTVHPGLQQPHQLQRLRRTDRRLAIAVHRRRELCVQPPVVAGKVVDGAALHVVLGIAAQQLAMPRIDAPARSTRCNTAAQLRFLHIQPVLDPAARAAMHTEVRCGRRPQRTGMHDRAMPWVVQHRVEVIDAAAAFALHRQIGVDGLGPAEQHQHLVQQVRAQVVPHAASRAILFAPALAHLRPVAIEMRMALGHVTKRTLRQQRLQGEEVGIEAPVLEHGRDAPGIVRRGQYCFGFGDVERERLVDQHMLARRQRGDRQRRMLVVGRACRAAN
ncbi:hypothetical protein G6F68_010811 [Rhizopus microsporus]|nr:hypothetical protein G6F68_010811 [Rhizopus microsporus]